jgi:hypothetical protein
MDEDDILMGEGVFLMDFFQKYIPISFEFIILGLNWQIFKALLYCYKSCEQYVLGLIINIHFVCMVHYKWKENIGF